MMRGSIGVKSTAWLLLLIGSVVHVQARSAVLFDESTVAIKSGSPVVVPDELKFTIAQQDTYRITLTDAGPSTAQNPKLIVTRGIVVAARVESSTPPQNFVDAVLAPGDYVLRMSGRAPAGSASQLNALVARGAIQIASHAVGLVPLAPPDPTLASLQAAFQVPTAGTFAIELTDRQLPAAFTSLQLTIVSNGVPVACVPASAACPGFTGTTFTANPGSYQIFVVGRMPTATPAGLFSIRIADVGSGQAVYANTHAVGAMTSEAVTLPAAATYSLSGTNFGVPAAPLAQLHLALSQDANASTLKNVTASATTIFAGHVGEAKLHVYAKPDATAQTGNYGVSIVTGAQSILGDVRAVNPSTVTNNEGFSYTLTLPSAGAYQVRLVDFELPVLGGLRCAIVQNGVVLDTLNVAGTVTVNAAAGELFLAVIATARAGDPFARGLIGLSVTSGATTTPIWERTQGVGGLFKSREIDVTAAGKYQASFLDQRFPAMFDDLLLVATRGATKTASIYAAGGLAPTTTTFDVVPGKYMISLLAVTSNTENYGLYGLEVEDVTPPQPPPASGGTNPDVSSGGGGGSVAYGTLVLLSLLLCVRMHHAGSRRNRLRRNNLDQACPRP